MMVASSPLGRLLQHTLDKAASGLHDVQQKSQKQPVSQTEYKNLLKALQQFNKQVPTDPSALKEKDLTQKEMQKSIEQALKESKLFKDAHFGRTGQRNAEATIAALFGNLQEEMKDFERNLLNLTLWKEEYEQLKYKVTKSSRTKRA